ncbi:hypothetical protein F0562_034050 [Nyssa sinensis]|uniref:VQ domain-containing protein n=1 Tax=Nyssa sinensis TaxID=561372 RepID=A0A5J5AJ26_9ASTE|nr:hypothetical protein F0562_034050 [Nyssa sinensis]
MSPAKFPADHEQARRVINGAHPSPLRINKDSLVIQKPSSSHAATKQQNPIIIHTHSPKIIHTQARDFMALVQKLTGVSRTIDDTAQLEPRKIIKTKCSEGENNSWRIKPDDNKSSSVVNDENCGGGGGFSVSPIFNPKDSPNREMKCSLIQQSLLEQISSLAMDNDTIGHFKNLF